MKSRDTKGSPIQSPGEGFAPLWAKSSCVPSLGPRLKLKTPLYRFERMSTRGPHLLGH